MKEFLFSKEELELIEFLKSNKPNKIWFDVIQYVFDYQYFYISIGIELGEKISDYEQILSAKIKKINSKFISQELSQILISDKKITEIYIVRTLFYSRTHTSNKDFTNEIININSIQINPRLVDDRIKKNKNVFICDLGIVLKMDKTFLNCFIYENNDDFFYINYIHQNDNLIEANKDIYEFIKFI